MGKRVYAADSSESALDAINTGVLRMPFRIIPGAGMDEVTYYFNPATVLWIESADSGRHCVIHSMEGAFKASQKLRYFEDSFHGMLIRAHASYLVNPLYVRSVKRFELTLTDGTVLSIPEKKYTAFRRALAEWDFADVIKGENRQKTASADANNPLPSSC